MRSTKTFARIVLEVCLVALGAFVASAVACSKGADEPGGDQGSDQTDGGTSTSSGAAGSSSSTSTGTAGTTGFITVPPSEAGAIKDSGRPPRCDEAGHCSCINIASIGRPAHYGTTDAFQNWLNTKSSATINLIVNRTTITKELLAPYDVIILQAMEDKDFGPFWKFDAAEAAALADWVKAGGGLISLTGYEEDGAEVVPVNQLLSFSGISYNQDNILNMCLGTVPCSCWGNSVQAVGWDPASPISANVKQVGAWRGRSINPGSAKVVAKDRDFVIAVTEEIGKGKVFVYSDEWVTFTTQWLATDQMQMIDMNSPCYDPMTMQMMTSDKVFQIPQWWYNVIRWVSPPSQCDFTIDNPAIIK
jgi:hypothetical protein